MFRFNFSVKFSSSQCVRLKFAESWVSEDSVRFVFFVSRSFRWGKSSLTLAVVFFWKFSRDCSLMLLCLLFSKLGNLESLFGEWDRLLQPQVAVRLRNLRYHWLSFSDLFSFLRFRLDFCFGNLRFWFVTERLRRKNTCGYDIFHLSLVSEVATGINVY